MRAANHNRALLCGNFKGLSDFGEKLNFWDNIYFRPAVYPLSRRNITYLQSYLRKLAGENYDAVIKTP